MSEMKRVVLYGGGVRGALLCKANRESGSGIEIAAVTDSDPSRWGTQCFDRTITPPALALRDPFVPVCIDVFNYEAVSDIRGRLLRIYHIPAENIVDYSTLLKSMWENSRSAAQLEETRLRATGRPAVHLIHDCNMGLGLGGIESWSNMLCSQLLKRGWSNLRIYVNSEPPKNSTLSKEWAPLSEHVDWIGSSSDCGQSPDTLQYLAEKMPCIIIVNSEETLCAACVLKKRYPGQVRIVSVLHAGVEALYQSRIQSRDYVDQFVTVSTDALRAMEERGCGREQLRCMKIPFACEKYLERSYSERGASPIKIGYAGRLEVTQKRMDLLLNLIQSLARKRLNFQLEIAGTGAYEGTIRDFIHRSGLGITGTIFLLGQVPRESIPGFWKRQDICINLSDYEGRSISITEAMGNGAVPVVTDVSGVRDDITDGVSGYIVPVGDYQAMADRIMLLAQNRERLKFMGAAAHDAVYPTSLIEHHIQFWEEILSPLAAELENVPLNVK